MRPFLVYTAGRIAIFVVLVGLLWFVGLTGVLLYLAALVLSVPVSFLALARQRAALARHLERRMAERRSSRERFRSRLRGEDGHE